MILVHDMLLVSVELGIESPTPHERDRKVGSKKKRGIKLQFEAGKAFFASFSFLLRLWSFFLAMRSASYLEAPFHT